MTVAQLLPIRSHPEVKGHDFKALKEAKATKP
jgi:hypothetical protein